MSDPTLPGTPGTGPEPPPEAEGFRDEQIEAEKQRVADEEEAQLQRSKDLKAFLSGEPEEVPPAEGTSTSTKAKKSSTKDEPPTTTNYSTKS